MKSMNTMTSSLRERRTGTPGGRVWGLIRSVVLLWLLVGTSACIRSHTTVIVRPDGSGNIEVLSLIAEEAATSMQEFAAMLAEEGAEPPSLFPEDGLREMAAEFGPGVTFVKSKEVKEDGFVGVLATFAFEDLNQVQVDTSPQDLSEVGSGMDGGDDGSGDMGSDDGMESEEEPQDPIRFHFEKRGDLSIIRAILPEEDLSVSDDEEADMEMDQDLGMPTEEELAPLLQLFDGLRFGTSIRTEGELVRTDATHRDGNEVTVYDIDFGALLSDLPKLQELAGRGEPKSMAEAAEWLADVPGMKVSLQEEIAIEFR